MNTLRRIEVQYLKGIGPQRAKILEKELGIRTAYDLLRHYPTSYADRSTIHRISDLRGETAAAVMLRGRFITINTQGEGAKRRLTALFTDGTGSIEVVWFQRIKQLEKAYLTGVEYTIFGKVSVFNGKLSMTHPEVDNEQNASRMEGQRGVYPIPERMRNKGFTSRMIYMWVQNVLATGRTITDTLPPSIVCDLKLMPLDQAIRVIHNPPSKDALDKAKFRLKFEELFFIQVDMVQRNLKRRSMLPGQRFTKIGQCFNSFYSRCLPFELTDAQKRVVKEIRADMNTGRQMNRLVQGDVGSGKTLVALLSMLIALDNACQACLMAPTEILAAQHYASLSEMVKPIGIKIGLLTGSTRASQRRKLHEQLRSGELQILVGTHALIEETVEFRNLGIAVIDEQHRFGVVQRAKLWRKNSIPPHVLVMTATPIPRTLAMTVYGDLDVSVIDELPPGRKPISTLVRYNEQRHSLNQFIFSEIKQGRQIYIVYPLIEENEKLDLLSLKEGYESVCETFPSCRVAFVHGKMKPDEKDHQMQLFVNHEADILVATTVIEVGVNVPNASVMVIENAERFGLSQLHQLRGRVGRGADKSYCVLMTKYNIAATSRKRLELMAATTDGFKIAEEDMRMRGPGDIEGTMQSGLPFALHIANLATDGQIIQLARDAAEKLISTDPELALPENSTFRLTLAMETARQADYSNIS